MLTRRDMIVGAAALSGGSLALGHRSTIVRADTMPLPNISGAAARTLSLDVAERAVALPAFGGKALPLWTFQDGTPFPVIRLKQGEPVEARVKNSLTRPGEHVTIHWHGLRIPNREDGVAYMTQEPIQPGAEGHYAFTPPETGTFFFHTHCNSVEHFGRGLFGALIVEGDEQAASDEDHVLLMKDWRLDANSAFLPFTTDEGAAKAGTPGTVRSINGVTKPVFTVASSANIRLRLLNVDPARISEIGLEGASAAIIAVDGNACSPMSLKANSWRLGPAGRLDILLRSPAQGGAVRLMDYFSAEPVVLAEFVSEGKPKRHDAFVVRPLRAGHYAAAKLDKAERLTFSFSATATGQSVAALPSNGEFLIGALCLSKRTFWAINQQPWPGKDHTDLGPPLAKLKRGQSYIFELKNLTPHAHPIHIHGHTFEVLTSNLRKLPPHRADTVLILPKERVEVALVADNPGNWMLHCHILEHQETGMMGYVNVS